ncbi:hypothetical protein [Pseudogulbenkiania sp. MAI-1]|uniref:hypothetical protein n=1 Tax=Pseudogulbenkiania sp. MAI-1 TaxID=990370 RepID=UPI00045E90B5|nr:hypothetical protein [Pseudogulbenkiania sp. MAI-1]
MIVPGRMLLVVAGWLLAACSAWESKQPVSPVSYQSAREGIPRTVGRLRRLAPIPIVQQPAKICLYGNDEIAIDYDNGFFQLVADYLAQRKGYELILPDPDRYPEWLVPPRNLPFLQEITTWSVNSQVEQLPGSSSRRLLERLRTGEVADGVLILHIHNSCSMANATERAMFGIMTLGFNELLTNPELEKPYITYRVSILEAASARPVWRIAVREDWLRTRRQLKWGGERTDEEYLFEDLEPAIPKLLTR